MRYWRVDAIRAYLSSVRTDWRLDEEFSRPELDVWIREAPDGQFEVARFRYHRAAGGRPAVVPETGVIDLCQQLGGIEPRLFLDALGAEGQYLGPPP